MAFCGVSGLLRLLLPEGVEEEGKYSKADNADELSYQRAKVKKGEREIALEEQTEIEFWELTELPEFSLMH